MTDQLRVPNAVTSVKLPAIPIESAGGRARASSLFGRSELNCNVSGHVGYAVVEGWTT